MNTTLSNPCSTLLYYVISHGDDTWTSVELWLLCYVYALYKICSHLFYGLWATYSLPITIQTYTTSYGYRSQQLLIFLLTCRHQWYTPHLRVIFSHSTVIRNKNVMTVSHWHPDITQTQKLRSIRRFEILLCNDYRVNTLWPSLIVVDMIISDFRICRKIKGYVQETLL